jgi:hypothetical protein
MRSPGDPILARAVVDGRVRCALPHTLVELTDERVVWLMRPGTACIAPAAYAEGRRHYVHDLARKDWKDASFVWHTNRVLRLTTFGRAHSFDLYWRDATDEFRGWYVNLQDPLVRTRFGFDFRDRILDIWIEPDGSWHWKDEDELELALGLGVLTSDEAAALRAEGERVVAECPWPTGWEDWRPDAAWLLPELPEDWNVV